MKFFRNWIGILSSFHCWSIKKLLFFFTFLQLMTCFVFQPKEQEHIYLFGFFTVNEFSVPGKKVFRDKVKHNCLSQLFFSFIIWSRDRKFGGKWDLNFCGITQFHPNLNARTNTVPTLCFNSSDMICWKNKYQIKLIFSTQKFCLKILSTLILHKMIRAKSKVNILTYIRIWFFHIPSFFKEVRPCRV